ncbi:MAG: DNA-3-methyladenine glycosylase [Haloferacaceae archaeon]
MDADAGADPAAALRTDPTMAALVDHFGPRPVEPADDGFRRLVVTVVNQSVSTAAARAVRERLFDAVDEVTPESVLAADREALADAGLGERKAEYVQNAARAWRDGDVSRAALADAPAEEVRERVTGVRGLGDWSADMYRLFVLGREDVFPVGDLAVRRAMTDLYGYADDERDAMVEHAERWRPRRSHATRYLWAYYEADERPSVP